MRTTTLKGFSRLVNVVEDLGSALLNYQMTPRCGPSQYADNSEKNFYREDRSDALHGGVVSGLIDIAGDCAYRHKPALNP
jgi:hypothetical protein